MKNEKLMEQLTLGALTLVACSAALTAFVYFWYALVALPRRGILEQMPPNLLPR